MTAGENMFARVMGTGRGAGPDGAGRFAPLAVGDRVVGNALRPAFEGATGVVASAGEKVVGVRLDDRPGITDFLAVELTRA